MRVLVAGAAGMLGPRRGRRRPAPRPRRLRARPGEELDITDPASIERRDRRVRPEAVINCAAWSDVDGAEDDERGATRDQRHRGGAPRRRRGADRRQRPLPLQRLRLRRRPAARPTSRTTCPDPIDAYGRSKLGGEVSVAAANPQHFIVRTSWLFGLGGEQLRRDDAADRRRAAGGAGRQRPARLPDLLRRPRRGDGPADRDRRATASTTWSAPGPAPGSTSPSGDLRPGPHGDPGDGGDHGDDGPQGETPRLLGARALAARTRSSCRRGSMRCAVTSTTGS